MVILEEVVIMINNVGELIKYVMTCWVHENSFTNIGDDRNRLQMTNIMSCTFQCPPLVKLLLYVLSSSGLNCRLHCPPMMSGGTAPLISENADVMNTVNGQRAPPVSVSIWHRAWMGLWGVSTSIHGTQLYKCDTESVTVCVEVMNPQSLMPLAQLSHLPLCILH